jgi:hypothetical protein
MIGGNSRTSTENGCRQPESATSGVRIEVLLRMSPICIFWLLRTNGRIKPNVLPCHANQPVFNDGLIDGSPRGWPWAARPGPKFPGLGQPDHACGPGLGLIFWPDAWAGPGLGRDFMPFTEVARPEA